MLFSLESFFVLLSLISELTEMHLHLTLMAQKCQYRVLAFALRALWCFKLPGLNVYNSHDSLDGIWSCSGNLERLSHLSLQIVSSTQSRHPVLVQHGCCTNCKFSVAQEKIFLCKKKKTLADLLWGKTMVLQIIMVSDPKSSAILRTSRWDCMLKSYYAAF